MTAQKTPSPQTPCRRERIDAFLSGELPDEAITELEQHLESCPSCDHELTRRTAADSFWHDTKRFLRPVDDHQVVAFDTAGPISETELGTGTRSQDAASELPGGQLGFLDPTDDPHMLGRFGGYEISGIIGQGGMGVVMKGWDVSLDRFVAIKVLNSNYACQSASRKRFAREAQAAAAVLHDNVIAIYGVDEWKGMPYLVMPYIKGESLQQRIDRSAPLPLEDILGIALQIARGLAAAHDQGLVHRDIKPANILMPSSVSRVIITDFGLARTADDASLTRSGVLAGTPQYMAPEQARGDTVDGRADLFSLGSVIYAMACGRPPFRAETPYAVLRKLTDEPHRRISQIRDDSPVWFERLVDRLLEKDPDDRFQDANELAAYLEDSLAHLRQPTTTILPTLDACGGRRRNFRSAMIAASLLAVALIVGGAAMLLPNSDPARSGPSVDAEPKRRGDPQTSPRGGDGESAPQASLEEVPHLQWEFDTSQIDRLETDLRILLNETRNTFPDESPTLTE